MTEPTLTIGIPLFNEEKFLRQTLQSVVDQSFENMKIVISENCSEDSSYLIAKEFADRDKRFVVIRQEFKLSALDNFKYVMHEATTPYFMWLGAHDVLINDFIGKGIKILDSEKKLSLVYPDVVPIDEDGKNNTNLNQDPNDDLDTTSLNQIDGLSKVAANTNACYAIHGIMRTESTKSIPFKKMIGPDHLIIFHLSTLGEVYHLRELGLAVRKFRKESLNDSIKRYVIEGIMKDDAYPYEYHMENYFRYVIKSSQIKTLNKIKLLIRFRYTFKKKFGVNARRIGRYFLYKLSSG